jgi:hypothetical protein
VVSLARGGKASPTSHCPPPSNYLRVWYSTDANDPVAGGITDRRRIADSLIDCGALIGLTRSQVQSLLGLPSQEFENGIWYYDLGPEGAGKSAIDNDLSLRFSPEGRVDRAVVVRFGP